MSNLFVAAAFAGILAVGCLLGSLLVRCRKKSRSARLLKAFSVLGSKNNLAFTSQLELHDCVMGVDGIHRKLLILRHGKDVFQPTIIDLDEVKRCTVYREYGPICAGSGVLPEECPRKIVLRFEFLDGRRPFGISFYDNRHQPAGSVSSVDRTVRRWQAILSKLLVRTVKQRA